MTASQNSPQRIALPGEEGVGEVAVVRLPESATLFASRAKRFGTLAENHSLAEWLNFMAVLSHAQHQALLAFPLPPLPEREVRQQACAHGMPPLNASALCRPAVWRDMLRMLADALLPQAPDAARQTLAALRAASDDALETWADTLLSHTASVNPADLALLPFVGAALQTCFTALAAQLDPSELPMLESRGVCPCCGSPAVASIVRNGQEVDKLRYLHCALCNTEWNVPRATCSACAQDKTVALQQIDGSNGAVRAETCDECKTYLKIVYQDKDHQVDPVADDLASLALDLLVDEAGYAKSGVNFLLVAA